MPLHHEGVLCIQRWRRGLSLLVAIFMLLQPATSSTTTITPGDLAPRNNTDGLIDAADALILRQFILGTQSPTVEELLAADVAPLGNPDGLLNAGDLVVLQRAVLGDIVLPPLPDSSAPEQADASLISATNLAQGEIEINGAAGSVESESTVTLVNFETGATAGFTANADGSFTGTIAGTTSHVFSVVVTDSSGNSSPSVSVATDDLLQLDIASPVNGITINDDIAQVTGTFSGPPGTAVIVNGQTACTYGPNFFVDIPLEPGENTLKISASIADGLHVERTQTVTSTGVTAFTVQADSPCGYAPHTVEFILTNNTGNTVVQIDADYDGDGTTDLSTSDPSASLAHTYSAAGIYPARFVIQDDTAAQYIATQTIVVTNLTDIDSQIRLVYNTMLDRLRVGAIDGALNQLTPTMQNNFKPVFQALGDSLPAVVNQLGSIAGGRIAGDLALYTVIRDESGTQMAYPVYLIRGNDGVWRIGQM